MKKVLGIAAIFIASYVVFAACYAPASLLTNSIALPKHVAIEQLEGTLWHAKAKRVNVGEVSVSDLDAQVNFFSLLLLSPEVNVTFGDRLGESPQGSASIVVDSETIAAKDARISLPASLVAPYVKSPVPIEAFGMVNADIASIIYQGNTCSEAIGKVNWERAAVSSLGETIELGRFDGQLRCDNKQPVLDISPNNLLGLSFSARLLANGRLTGSGFIKPDENFPPKLKDLLQFIGKPDNQGRYRIRL